MYMRCLNSISYSCHLSGLDVKVDIGRYRLCCDRKAGEPCRKVNIITYLLICSCWL
nr:unnamed protein product [Callosobruchus chinensis]